MLIDVENPDAIILFKQIYCITWCWIFGISISLIYPRQVKSRFSHNTLQGYFHREGIRLIPLTLHWLDLKRPLSCDQTVIVLHQVYGLLSAKQEPRHLVHVRQSRRRRDSTCLWRCVIASLENLIVVIVGLEPTPTRPNLPPLPVKQIPYSNICNHLMFSLIRLWADVYKWSNSS